MLYIIFRIYQVSRVKRIKKVVNPFGTYTYTTNENVYRFQNV